MKFTFTRDLATVSRRERIAAGIVSTVVGGFFIVYMDIADGGSLEGAILRVIIATITGVAICTAYSKWKEFKAVIEEAKARLHRKEIA